MVFKLMNLGHVSFPVIFSRECLPSCSGVVTPLDGAVKLLLLLVPVIYVSLEMSLGAESFTAFRIRALVLFAVISLMMPDLC